MFKSPTIWRIVLLLFSMMLTAAAQDVDVPDVQPAIRSRTKASRDYAIVVANESYSSLPQVTYGYADGNAFYDYLRYTRGVSKWRIRKVRDANAKRLKKELGRGRYNSRTRGTLWLYYVGHGAVDQDGHRLLLGTDANPMDPTTHGVKLNDVLKYNIRGKYSQIIVVLDAGFGHQGRDGLDLVPGSEMPSPGRFEPLDDKVYIWAADQSDGPAKGYRIAQHGLHTYTVLGALRGWADGAIDGKRDGELTVEEVELFTRRTQNHLGRPTSPSVEERVEKRKHVLIKGRYFERSPAPARFSIMAQQDLAYRIDEKQARLKAEANALWQATVMIAEERGEGAEAALENFLQEYESVTVALDWAVHIPEAVMARQLLSQLRESGASAIAAAAEDTKLASCENLIELESSAMQGSLTEGQTGCLEYRLLRERLQTEKSDISIVLIVNAQTSGQEEEWDRLVGRHLEEFDRSDPNLCFQYAVRLHRAGVAFDEDAIRWADVALENKHVWNEDTYSRNVNALLKLRAQASQLLWQESAMTFAEDDSMENEALTNELKNEAMSMAREWLDYARASQQSQPVIRLAQEMCASAAGTIDACQ